jgi:hypothetical protein
MISTNTSTGTDKSAGKGSVFGRTRTGKADLRQTLARLKAEHPDMTKKALREEYRELVLEDPVLNEVAVDQTFENEWANLLREAEKEILGGKARSPTAIAKLKADMEAWHVKGLLRLVMLDGRQLREYTGQELREAGGIYRRLFHAIAGTVAPGAVIGEVYKRERDLLAAIGL